MTSDFNEQVREALNRLDGTPYTAYMLLADVTKDELNELGGMDDQTRTD